MTCHKLKIFRKYTHSPNRSIHHSLMLVCILLLLKKKKKQTNYWETNGSLFWAKSLISNSLVCVN